MHVSGRGYFLQRESGCQFQAILVLFDGRAYRPIICLLISFLSFFPGFFQIFFQEKGMLKKGLQHMSFRIFCGYHQSLHTNDCAIK
jgi:hypothetical protein